MTRDPGRIDEAVEALRTYWAQNPDLRLGQIVMNAMKADWSQRYSASMDEVYRLEEMPLFYLEDDRIVRGLHLMIEGRAFA